MIINPAFGWYHIFVVVCVKFWKPWACVCLPHVCVHVSLQQKLVQAKKEVEKCAINDKQVCIFIQIIWIFHSKSTQKS